MRISNVLALSLLGAAMAMPVRASAQVDISLSLGRQLGPAISVYAYSPSVYGDWRTTHTQWAPVTMYYYDGHYYRRSVKGSRAVVVYSHNNEYFFPPPDRAWVGVDKRYDYKHAPNDEDRGRAKGRDDNPGRGRGRGRGDK